MQKQTEESPCVRCGKTRIVAKVWKEYVGHSVVTCTITVCPDDECQKIVDEGIAARREKSEALLKNRALAAGKRARSTQQANLSVSK